MLRLSPEEVVELNRILEAHRSAWSAFEVRARTERESCNREYREAPGDPPHLLLAAGVNREWKLTRIADEQAALDTALLEAMRAKFEDGRRADWWRCRYAIDRARSANLTGGMPAIAPDVPALVSRVMSAHPDSVRDAGSLRDMVGAFCERAVRSTEFIREADVAFARNFFRSLAEATRPRGGDTLPDGVRRPASGATRRTLELMERRARVVHEQARHCLATRESIEALLDEPALTMFQKGFWRSVARACGVTWWPDDLERFQAEMEEMAPEETREALRRLFVDAWKRALGRIIAIEGRIRNQIGSTVQLSPRAPDAVQEIGRRADEQECEALNALCASAIEMLPVESRQAMPKPVFKPMQRSTPSDGKP